MQLYKEQEIVEWEIGFEEIKKLPSLLGFPVLLFIIIAFYFLYLFFVFPVLLNILGGNLSMHEFPIKETVLLFGPILIISILWFLYYNTGVIKNLGKYYKYSLDKNGVNIQNFKSNKSFFYPWDIFDFFYNTGGFLFSGDNLFLVKKEKDFLGGFDTVVLRVSREQKYKVSNFVSKYLSFKILSAEMSTKEANLVLDRKLKEKFGEKFYLAVFFIGLVTIISTFFIILVINNINITDRWILKFLILIAPVIFLLVSFFIMQELKIRNAGLNLLIIILGGFYIIAFKFFPDRLFSLIGRFLDFAFSL